MKMLKKIEFKVDENQRPIDIVRMLRDMLNVRYHHHYIQDGRYILEYFDLD